MSELFIRNNQFNIGYICSTLQCERGLGNKKAMRWISASKETADYSFLDLEIQSNTFANVLQNLGFSKGDVFFTFLPKMPEQFFAFLGALKNRTIVGTLFSNFGEEAILDRIGDAKAKGIITKQSYLRKIIRIREQLPSLQYIIVVDSEIHQSPETLSYKQLMQEASDQFDIPLTDSRTPSVLHYTSGSTGKPKGVLHVHNSVLMQNQTTREILSLEPDDLYWCTADQGWVTGTSYGIIGPWSLGVTQIHFGGGYNAEEWFTLLENEKVTIWYTAPTALRMLMREDPALYAKFQLPHLRHIFSVGEPLNPEIIHWSRRVLKHEIYDTWWQTETGAIMIANRPGMEIRPGSMGKPVRGIEPAILADNGEPVKRKEQGNLCLKAGWPSMFVTYLNNEQVYKKKFMGDHYFSGDTAYEDEDGYYWFMGRSDDVINTAGHLVSPFEVESALLEIEEVAESGVIGAPDDIMFEKVVAYVCLHQQYNPSEDLILKMRIHISNKVSTFATPQEYFFVDSIPKTKSGKIMRRVLKAKYMGTDTGDISTMEI